MSTRTKLFSKDFTLVVIGQIISLFGNAVIRFALPLYLLNQTGSSTLYGVVTGCAFIPFILLSPVGGILADKVNKRNIMVVLDFITAAVILSFSLLMDGLDLVLLLTVTLMLLYGIAGAYQPAVQASVPSLVREDNFIQANAVINMISSLSSLAGPVLGGILYSSYGLKPVLWVCVACFLASAIMEIFIHIPFAKAASESGIWNMLKNDLKDSIRFIRKDKPVIGRVLLVTCGINLFLSALILVGLPYMITEVLCFEPEQANKLYGFAQGVLGAGGLAGGICTGIFAKRLTLKRAGSLIVIAAVCVLPMGLSLMVGSSALLNYIVMTTGCFLIMICSTIFSVQMMAFVQIETPRNLIGKVTALILTVSMCAQPLGSALYGILFDICKGLEFSVFLFSSAVSLGIAIGANRIFWKLQNSDK